MMDPLTPLLNLADVAPAVKRARDAVDGAYRQPALRRKGGTVAAEVSLRCAVASAALQGRRYEVDEVRAGTVLDPVLQGALRVAEALPGLVDRWPTVPRQVLAKVHVLAGTGLLAAPDLGRPVGEPTRLDQLCELVITGSGDALIRASVVHGELLALNAFPGVNGVVARAAARLTLVSSGLDPRGLIAIEEVHLAREPEYLGCAGAFATGTADGVRSWLRHCALAIELGSA